VHQNGSHAAPPVKKKLPGARIFLIRPRDRRRARTSSGLAKPVFASTLQRSGELLSQNLQHLLLRAARPVHNRSFLQHLLRAARPVHRRCLVGAIRVIQGWKATFTSINGESPSRPPSIQNLNQARTTANHWIRSPEKPMASALG
jgi:hypothetical protein